jgi:hypothetical protein
LRAWSVPGGVKAMRLFKQQLLDLLRDHGWELVSRDGDTDWWVEEHWLVRSVRENWGAKLVLSFLVDPHYNGPKKSRAIWMIGATTEMPQDRLEAERGIALRCRIISSVERW